MMTRVRNTLNTMEYEGITTRNEADGIDLKREEVEKKKT